MPSLSYQPSENSRQRTIQLFKRITTIGDGAENDISIPDAGLSDTHAHIHFDGNSFNISCLDKQVILVNNLKVKAHKLGHKDRIRLGETELTFFLYDEPVDNDESDLQTARLDAYRKMLTFSNRLLANNSIDDLLNALLDAVIELTRADKGMLILLEGNLLQVKAARNLKKETIEDAIQKVSDTIVAQVVKSKQALIVSDALNHETFKTSESVVNLKLCSVMAAPLMEKGDMFGILYVGNDNVVNLFEEHSLEVLTVFAAQASLLVQNALLLNELLLDNQELTERLERMRFGEIIGACDAMKEIFRKIDKISQTDISVLITGETGTGKELVARRIHALSPRVKGPFVTINCGAIPENLLESELFGHVKGAFTGAVATRTGKFQAADGGTLFLDEIGELPPQLQVKLLRALQEKSVTKVGDNRTEKVNIRIISATNRDLEKGIKDGNFREDLYYRIKVVGLHLPPLCERGEDLPLIAKYLLNKFAEEFTTKVKGFTPAAVIAMRKYSWPGNIRQLENRIKRAIVLADKTHLGAEDLDLNPEDFEPVLSLSTAKEEFQRRYINDILARNNGNRTKTARDLGVDPRTIFRHLEKQETE
ncbi:MAG: sigma 54-interacting transcriptional regulator [Deltaproteobacteria bacterium]|nr:sigma 54-interacting transcriptional regulator [Deltaproteobacteria bacterium]